MQSARVRRTGASLHEAMAPAQQRLPTSGKIRPGIKVLTKKALNLPGAREIYNNGVAAGVSFDDIEKRLKSEVEGCPAYPLTPRNSAFFRVMQQDFTAPGAAAAILDRYDEERGEGKQLYEFPIEFVTDDIDTNFREQFEAWRASELFRWSEVRDGRLQCMKRQEVQAERSKRRRWGSRPIEAVRDCDPNGCDVFAAGNCQHNGTLYFTIPGCEFGIFELSFTSIYASMGVVEACELVEKMLGRVRGTLGGPDKPVFWVTKQHKAVSRVDWEKGKATRQDQWIITLVPNLKGIAEYLRERNDKPAIAAPADKPALTVVEDSGTNPSPNGSAPDPANETGAAGAAQVASKSDTASAGTGAGPSVKVLRAERATHCRAIGWDSTTLKEWLDGNGYTESDGHDASKLQEQVLALGRLAGAMAAKQEQEPVQGEFVDEPAFPDGPASDDPF